MTVSPKNKLIPGNLYKFIGPFEFRIFKELNNGEIEYECIFPQDAIVLFLGEDPVHYYKESYSKFLYKNKIVYVSFTEQLYLTKVV